MAAGHGHDKVVELLLKQESIELNKATYTGTTPLFIAAGKGYVKVVEALLAQTGIELNKARFDGVTPLYIAAQNGHDKEKNDKGTK